MRTRVERLGLRVVKFPADAAAVALKQIEPIVRFHMEGFNAWSSIREQMERLAFDAYSQGLIDGNQIPKVKP